MQHNGNSMRPLLNKEAKRRKAAIRWRHSINRADLRECNARTLFQAIEGFALDRYALFVADQHQRAHTLPQGHLEAARLLYLVERQRAQLLLYATAIVRD